MGEDSQAPLQPQALPAPGWTLNLDPREREQILHARTYAVYHPSAGVPGHGQFLLIAKLARLLDEREPFAQGGA